MADLLPGFTYDRSSARYRSAQTGKFVARRDILSQLDAQVRGGEQRLANLTTAFHEGRLSASVWQEQMTTEIRRMHLQNAALGAGGWDRLESKDFGRVGGKLRADYQRLESFAKDIQDGKLSIAQAIARSELYAGNARTQFWDAERERQIADLGMVAIERRRLGSAEHCQDCVNYYDRGWTMAGQLPSPGVGSVCLTRCKCSLHYNQVEAAELSEWLNTKR